MVRTLKLFAFVSLLSIIQFAYPTSAKAAYGDWTIYAAYHHATKVAVLNKIVYVLSDNGLYSYDPEDTHQVSWCWTPSVRYLPTITTLAKR